MKRFVQSQLWRLLHVVLCAGKSAVTGNKMGCSIAKNKMRRRHSRREMLAKRVKRKIAFLIVIAPRQMSAMLFDCTTADERHVLNNSY